MASSDGRVTTRDKAEAWETAMPLLQAMFDEFRELSKKKPDGAVGKPKIAVVNRLLGKCRGVVQDEDTFPFLDLLNEDEIPQNSDVVLMLSQYMAALKTFRSTYYVWDDGEQSWAVKNSRR